MRRVVVAVKHLSRLLLFVGPVHIVDGDDSEVAVVTEITERHTRTSLHAHAVNRLLRDIERNRNGKEIAICETVVGYNTLVILLVHKACAQNIIRRARGVWSANHANTRGKGNRITASPLPLA